MKQLKQLEPTVLQKIEKLNKLATETLEAILTTKNLSKAAELLNISRPALYARIEKHELDELIAMVKRRAITTLVQGSVDAAENLVNKVSSSDEEVSVKASGEVLDRIGIVKPQRSGGEINLNFNNLATTQKADYDL